MNIKKIYEPGNRIWIRAHISYHRDSPEGRVTRRRYKRAPGVVEKTYDSLHGKPFEHYCVYNEARQQYEFYPANYLSRRR